MSLPGAPIPLPFLPLLSSQLAGAGAFDPDGPYGGDRQGYVADRAWATGLRLLQIWLHAERQYPLPEDVRLALAEARAEAPALARNLAAARQTGATPDELAERLNAWRKLIWRVFTRFHLQLSDRMGLITLFTAMQSTQELMEQVSAQLTELLPANVVTPAEQQAVKARALALRAELENFLARPEWQAIAEPEPPQTPKPEPEK